jgi:hypothetical protein
MAIIVSVSTKDQFPVLWKLLPDKIILVTALPVSLVGNVSRVPSGVQVMIEVTHIHLKRAGGVPAILFDLGDRTVQLLFGFFQMKKYGSAIHTDNFSNSGW